MNSEDKKPCSSGLGAVTDIEALRARMRELAKAVVAASEAFDGSKEAEASLDAANAEFDLACTADRILALDAEITRIREDLDRVTRERDAQYDENVNRIAAEGAAILRAEAAEAALAKRDEEVARLLSAMDREEAYLHRMIDASEENGGIMHGDLEGAFHRIRDKDSDDAERAEAPTEEPTNAER